jgi:hypothetical protein
MCYSLPAGGKTSLAVEPAVLDAASLLEELTAAAEATSATRARAATLNKEESILIRRYGFVYNIESEVPMARHLYCSTIKVSVPYGRSPRPYQAARTSRGRQEPMKSTWILWNCLEKVQSCIPVMSSGTAKRQDPRAKAQAELVLIARVLRTRSQHQQVHKVRQKQDEHVYRISKDPATAWIRLLMPLAARLDASRH